MYLYFILVIIAWALVGYSYYRKRINKITKEDLKESDYKIYENNEITKTMLKKIQKLDKDFFELEYLWDEVYQKQIFYKNKNSMIILMYKNKLIGYLNYLVVTKDKYNLMINSDTIVDDFTLNEIDVFKKNKKNYLTLNSVVIDKKFQNGYPVRLITERFKNILKHMNDNNCEIAALNAFAVSKDGRKFLENLGFEMKKELKDKNCLYILEGKSLRNVLK